MTTVGSAWEKHKLSNLIHIKHGYAFKGEYFHDSPTPNVLVTPGNFAIGGGFQKAKLKYYNGPIPQDYVLRRGALIVTMTDLSKAGDTLGYSAIVPADNNLRYLHNQRIGLVEKKRKDVDLKFLFYLMRTRAYQKFVVGSASGAIVKHTSPGRICDYEVRMPDYPMQTRIASVLSAYDDLIENNEKRIKTLEEMAQLLYTEWFVKFKFPGHEKVKMVDSGTDFGRIPEGWHVGNVESLIKRISVGKKYENKTVSKEGAVPVLDQGKTGIIGYHDDEPGVKASITNPVIVFANHTCYQNIIVFPFSAIQNVLPFVPNDNRNIFWLHWATKDLIRFNDYKGHWPEFMSKKLIGPAVEVTNKFGCIVGKYIAMKYVLELHNKNLSKTRDLLISQLVMGNRQLQ